ncbi:Alpha/Beta hydrolase protein [Mycena galopus ATCC 62051]|nr:Alpha/Beta hydrolase protein [Mycena galopus ATCC 62051]
MNMSSMMPPELTDRTIDFQWESQRNLRACSLVCKQWLPSSRRHIFTSITVRPDGRFAALVQSPSNVVGNYTRILNFPGCQWPHEMDDTVSRVARHLPTLHNLTTVIVGSFPPSPKIFPVLPQVTKLSLQHTRFASGSDFAEFLSKFTTLRELELAWLTLAHNDGVWPCLTELEYLGLQGFERAPDILRWLSSADYSPRPHKLALSIPNDAPDPDALSILSKFLQRLDGHLQYLRLEVLPSTYLQWTFVQLNPGCLSSLQRLRIGHGINFYPSSTVAPLGACRVFPAVLEIALGITSRNRLAELTFDVDVVPDPWTTSSDSGIRTILTNHYVDQIPIVRFQVVQAATPVVDLGYSQYQGMVDSTNTTTFLGIRYAAAPMGDLRFRAPQSPENTTEVQKASTQPNQCFQAGTGESPTNPLSARAAVVVPSEDCLFLSVYYPSDAEGTPIGPLPVIVWIHGGGYVAGNASMYRGTDLIAQSDRGVVVVTIQYRLGIFGFLSGAAVKENGALNAGLLDQDFALRWVNKYISNFGGDPSKVTIWGESAGAGSVIQHIVANNGQTEPQLFRGAISSSTFLPSQYHYNDPIPELVYSQVVAQTNCSAVADSMACLRATDVDLLEIANLNICAAAFYGTYATVPVVDEEFITQRPTLLLAQSKVNGEALLSVTNAFEGTIFVNQSTTASANATEFALELFPNFEAAQADEVGALYAGLGTPIFQINAVMGESIFICPTYYLLRAFAGRAFKGEFAIPPATHGLDVEYYFPSLLIDFPELTVPLFNNTAFIDAFAQSFTSFAISLDPNIKVDPQNITPQWNKWDVGQSEMLFNKTAADIPVVQPVNTADALLERCRFWESVGGLTAQ